LRLPSQVTGWLAGWPVVLAGGHAVKPGSGALVVTSGLAQKHQPPVAKTENAGQEVARTAGKCSVHCWLWGPNGRNVRVALGHKSLPMCAHACDVALKGMRFFLLFVDLSQPQGNWRPPQADVAAGALGYAQSQLQHAGILRT
jgi:hypothetical protein